MGRRLLRRPQLGVGVDTLMAARVSLLAPVCWLSPGQMPPPWSTHMKSTARKGRHLGVPL